MWRKYRKSETIKGKSSREPSNSSSKDTIITNTGFFNVTQNFSALSVLLIHLHTPTHTCIHAHSHLTVFSGPFVVSVQTVLKCFICVEQGYFVFLCRTFLTHTKTKIRGEASLPVSASRYDDIHMQYLSIHISAWSPTKYWCTICCKPYLKKSQ